MTKLGRHIDNCASCDTTYCWNSRRILAEWMFISENNQRSWYSNTVYGVIKRFRERGNFVCGRRTRRPRKTNDRDDRVLYRLARENRRFSVQRLRRAWQPNVNFALSGKTVNRRLVARAYRARRMVKVSRLTVRAKLSTTSLGPETRQSTTRPMATCHLLQRKSIPALPDRQWDPCSKTGWRSHE